MAGGHLTLYCNQCILEASDVQHSSESEMLLWQAPVRGNPDAATRSASESGPSESALTEEALASAANLNRISDPSPHSSASSAAVGRLHAEERQKARAGSSGPPEAARRLEGRPRRGRTGRSAARLPQAEGQRGREYQRRPDLAAGASELTHLDLSDACACCGGACPKQISSA